MSERFSSKSSKDSSISVIRLRLCSSLRSPSLSAVLSCSSRREVSSCSLFKRLSVSSVFFCCSVVSVKETRWASSSSAIASLRLCSSCMRSCSLFVFSSSSVRSFSSEIIVSAAVFSFNRDKSISSSMLSVS